MPAVPPEALRTLKTFLDASLAKDKPTMMACLTRASAESGQFSDGPEGVTFEIGDAVLDSPTTLVATVRATPTDASAEPATPQETPIVLTLEEGQWKVDLLATIERTIGGSLQAAVDQLASSMGQVMDAAAQALSEGLSSAFAEQPHEPTAEELAWDSASLVPSASELHKLPKLAPLPKTASAVSAAMGQKVAVHADIPGLLKTVGSDDSATLINWFDDSLYADWQNVFTQALAQIPKPNPLRSVRIEPAAESNYRLLAVDGSDIVYRMYLNHTDGYYSDAEILAILPGLLVELPETLCPPGRLIPTDDQSPSVEDYQQHSVPRYMKRIRALLGAPIRLEADWSRIANWTNSAQLLPRWGLNRVYAALCLALNDPALGAEIRKSFRAIDLSVGSVNPEARYEDGTLRLSLSGYSGPRLGLYAHELVPVLAGTPVE